MCLIKGSAETDLRASRLLALALHARLVVRLVGTLTQLVVQFVLARGSALHLDCQVYSRGSRKAKTKGYLRKIKLVYVEDVALAVARVGLQI